MMSELRRFWSKCKVSVCARLCMLFSLVAVCWSWQGLLSPTVTASAPYSQTGRQTTERKGLLLCAKIRESHRQTHSPVTASVVLLILSYNVDSRWWIITLAHIQLVFQFSVSILRSKASVSRVCISLTQLAQEREKGFQSVFSVK